MKLIQHNCNLIDVYLQRRLTGMLYIFLLEKNIFVIDPFSGIFKMREYNDGIRGGRLGIMPLW